MDSMPQYGWNSQQQGAWNDQSQRGSSNVLPVWRGSLARGTAPAQSRFQPPSAGVSPNFSGANAPLINNTAPAGTFTNMITQATQGFINEKARQGVEAKATKDEALRKAMKGARANNKIAALRGARGLGLPPAGSPVTTTLPPPVGTRTMLPPSGTPSATTLPPPVGSSMGAPAVVGAMPFPNPTAPPMPPKSIKKAGTPSSPFSLPPLTGMGGDFLTQSIRSMAEPSDGEPTPPPTNVQWKDEPTNPFPMGTRKPFDASRMFDPSYKPSESITSSPSSRTMNRPRK